MFSDTEYIPSPPLSKMFPNPVDTSPQKLYHDETELFSDGSITKHLSKEVEAVVESPVRKTLTEELEACIDVSCRKMAKEESLIEATSRKISRDRSEVPMDAAVRKVLSNELDAEFLGRKVERDTMGDLMDTASKNIYRERSDLPLDMRKIIWNELEATTVTAPRKISRDMMGISMDSASRKMIPDDVEHRLYSVPRRITRDSMGTSFDTGSRKFTWTNEDCQLNSSVRVLAIDNMVEAPRTPPRKISRDELDYFTDTASINVLPRERFDPLMDTSSSTEKQEFSLGPSTSRRVLRDELEISTGSLKRKMPRIDIDTSTETPTGKISWDKVDLPMEIPKQSVLREELGASESSSSPCRIGQPDLMFTSHGPWNSSSELFAGPLSQLVYDGILEKSCNSGATTPTSLSASTPNLPQSGLLAEVEPRSRIALTPPASSPETGEENNKHQEKSKKSSKLKNLFKKKTESTPEKSQSGLQNL